MFLTPSQKNDGETQKEEEKKRKKVSKICHKENAMGQNEPLKEN